MFVDMGHAQFSATIGAFTKGGMSIKSCRYDENLGGRNLNERIAAKFSQEFQAKHNVDLREIPKSWIKLLQTSNKLKKNVAAQGVNQANQNLECIYKEKDFLAKIT